MPRVDHCVWNTISILPGEPSEVTMSSLIHCFLFVVIIEKEVCFFF